MSILGNFRYWWVGPARCNKSIKTTEEATPHELREASHAVSNVATELQAITYRLQREVEALRKLADEITRGH